MSFRQPIIRCRPFRSLMTPVAGVEWVGGVNKTVMNLGRLRPPHGPLKLWYYSTCLQLYIPLLYIPQLCIPLLYIPLLFIPLLYIPLLYIPLLYIPIVHTPIVHTTIVHTTIVHTPIVHTTIVHTPIDKNKVSSAYRFVILQTFFFFASYQLIDCVFQKLWYMFRSGRCCCSTKIQYKT